jgi:hypothetical protein
VLFGGKDVDNITGSTTEADLITGGSSNYDKIGSSPASATQSKAVIDAILAAWSSAANVAAAVQTLNVTGLTVGTQSVKLSVDQPGAPITPNTVVDDDVVDTIIAGTSQDWLFLEDNNLGDETPATSTLGSDIVTDLG